MLLNILRPKPKSMNAGASPSLVSTPPNHLSPIDLRSAVHLDLLMAEIAPMLEFLRDFL